MKKVLYISAANEESSIEYRKRSFCSYLSKCSELTVLNLLNDKNSYLIKFLRKIIDKTSFLPDSYIIYYFFYRKKIKALLKSNKFDYVFIQTLPFTLLLFCDLVKKVQPSVKIVVDMSDPIVINAKFKNFGWLKQWELKKIEDRCLAPIDYLIVLNEEIKNYYATRVKSEIIIIIIEQGTDGISCIKKNEYSLKLRFLYAGMFYQKLREPYSLYKAVEIFENKVLLTVCGSFKKKFTPPLKECVKYLGRVSKASIQQLYSETDVIVFIDNNNSYQIPGKIFEVLSSNKAILFIYFNEDSPTFKYIDDVEGIFITHNNEEEIKQTIEKIICQHKNIYSRDIEKYRWENLLKRLNFLIDLE